MLWVFPRRRLSGARGRCAAGFRCGLRPVPVIRDRGGRSHTTVHVRFAPKADNPRKRTITDQLGRSALCPLADIASRSAGRGSRQTVARGPGSFRPIQPHKPRAFHARPRRSSSINTTEFALIVQRQPAAQSPGDDQSCFRHWSNLVTRTLVEWLI